MRKRCPGCGEWVWFARWWWAHRRCAMTLTMHGTKLPNETYNQWQWRQIRERKARD